MLGSSPKPRVSTVAMKEDEERASIVVSVNLHDLYGPDGLTDLTTRLIFLKA
jgi:hypothetical protein